MADKIIGIRPDGTLNPETIAAVKEIAGTGTGSVVVTDDGAGTYTVGGTTIKGLTTQGQLPAVAKKYVDDGLAGKANTAHTHTWAEVTGKPTTFTPSKHTHTTADVTGLDAALAGKAATDHTHNDQYYTKAEVTELLKNRPPFLILGPTDPVPSGTAEGTLIARSAQVSVGVAGAEQPVSLFRYTITTPQQDPSTPLPATVARRAVVLGTSHSDKTWTQSGGVWWWQVAADLAGITVLDDYAVGGMDTEGALNGWSGNTPQIVAAEQSPADLALVEFGGNDAKLGVTPDVFRQRLTQLVIRLKAAGKRVVIVFPPPLFRALQGGFGDTYVTLRGVAREVAAANAAYYTDAWDAMSTGGGANPAYDSGDNMHLNGAGQLAWGRAVAADLQAFAGVTDPVDGVRDRYWFDPSTSMGDASQIAMGKNPDDALFHGRDGAVISAGAQDLSIFNDVSKEAGSRWEISYAYRVEAGSTEDGATGVQVEWPGPVMRDLPGRARLVGQEGVRRVEMVVPASATDACVAALRIPAAAKGLRLRVGQLGARRVA